MITIIPMVHHNSTDSWGTWLELDLTPPSGLWSPTVTGPYLQVHSVLVCFISLLEKNLLRMCAVTIIIVIIIIIIIIIHCTGNLTKVP